MSTAAEPDLSVLRQFSGYSLTEWRSVCAANHNVLFEGPKAAIEAVLLVLEPRLRTPVTWKRSRAPFDVPTVEVGGLIVEDVAALSPEEQRRLLVWLDGAGSRTQIVATTERPLFPLVAAGLFDATLYYRLNVMLLRLSGGRRREVLLPPWAVARRAIASG